MSIAAGGPRLNDGASFGFRAEGTSTSAVTVQLTHALGDVVNAQIYFADGGARSGDIRSGTYYVVVYRDVGGGRLEVVGTNLRRDIGSAVPSSADGAATDGASSTLFVTPGGLRGSTYRRIWIQNDNTIPAGAVAGDLIGVRSS